MMSDRDSNIQADPNENCNILFSELENVKKTAHVNQIGKVQH